MPDLKTIRQRFKNKPITLLKMIDSGIRFPQKLRTIFAMLWLETDGTFDKKGNPKRCTRFIVKGPRGGGKSKMLGAIGFAKWLMQYRSIVDMGGSLEQAKGVYNYFAAHCYSSEAVLRGLPKDPAMQQSKTDKGNYFKAVAASPKQVRGPHPDVLMIDEACETSDELILSALPMVNTSPNQLIVMTSTFHKIFGLFQETWDHAKDRGYVRMSWDILDVVQQFDPKIFDDEQLRREIPDLQQLVERIGGRTGDPEGWVTIHNVIQAWREKRTVDWFDVEYMGSRPSASGMVNDPVDVDACVIKSLNGFGYKKGAEVVLGLDWGFSGMTALVELMGHKDLCKVQLDCRTFTQTPLEVIVDYIVERVELHGIRKIYADSAGKFENDYLRNALNKKFKYSEFRCVVEEVVFSKFKFGSAGKDGAFSMLGNYRTHIQRHLLKIPKDHKEAIWQHKRYHYQKGSDKPVKEDDHIPDATMLALKHWPLGIKSPSIIPKSNVDNKVQRSDEYSTITGGLLDERF